MFRRFCVSSLPLLVVVHCFNKIYQQYGSNTPETRLSRRLRTTAVLNSIFVVVLHVVVAFIV